MRWFMVCTDQNCFASGKKIIFCMKHLVRTKNAWGAYRFCWCNAKKFVHLKGRFFDVKIKLGNKHTDTNTQTIIYVYMLIVFLSFSMKVCQK